MVKKLAIIIRSVLVLLLAFAWFIFAQAEYEMITKPELQNDFPVVKGIHAVGFMGFILLVLAITVIFLLYSIRKSLKKNGTR